MLLWNVEQRSIARVFGPDLDYHGDFVERFHFTADGTKLNVYFTYTEDDMYRSTWTEWTSYSLENLGEKEGPFSVDYETIEYNRDRSQDKWEGYQLLLRDRDATGLQWLSVTENGATIRYLYDKDAAVWAKKLLLIPTGIDVKEIRVASFKNRLAMACGADGLVIVDIAKVEEEYHPVSKLRADMKYDWIVDHEISSY